jgi:hypothetical protein
VAFSLGSIKAFLDLDTSGFTSGVGKGLGLLSKIALPAAAAAAAVAGIAAAFGALKDGIGEAAAAEQALTKLTSALDAQGGNGAALAQQFTEFAGAFERLTGIDDAKLTDVAAKLTNLGVAGKSLPAATQAVANLSAAMGVDMETAAQQLALTLEGTAGRLARIVPEVGKLTEEQLRNGEAFDLVAEKFDGAAAKLGGTFSGNLERARQGFDDLKKAVGEGFIQAMTPALESLNQFLTRLGETPAFMDALRTVGSLVGNAIAAAFQVASHGLAGFMVMWQQGLLLFQQGSAVWQSWQGAAQNAIAAVSDALAGLAAKAAEFVSNLPVIGEGLAAALNAVSESAATSATSLRLAAVASEQGAMAAREAATAQERNATAARQFAVAVANAKGPVDAIKLGLKGAADAAGLAAGNSVKLAQGIGTAVASANKLPSTAQLAAEAFEAAAARAASLRGELEGAADAAQAAASAASGIGGGSGGGGGGGDPFGRRSGGSRSLNTSNAAGTAAELAAAEKALANMRPNAFAGAAGIQSQRKFVESLRATLAAQVAEEQKAFTNTILSELSSRGIFDPAERNRILSQRIGEATRLGVIPRMGSVGGTGSALSRVAGGGGGSSTGGTPRNTMPPTWIA